MPKDYPYKPDDCPHTDIDWKLRTPKEGEPFYSWLNDQFNFGDPDVISVTGECADCGKRAQLHYRLVRFGEELF